MIYKSSRCFLPSFESTGVSVQEKKRTKDGFPIVKFLAIFDLQVTNMLPIMFRVNWPFVQEKKREKHFQDGLMAAILDFRS